jgi:hypothetical protein
MNSAMYFRVLSVACRNKTLKKDAANGNFFAGYERVVRILNAGILL